MSWSSIDYGKCWAHAHDWEQILFMHLAPEFLAQDAKFAQERWLVEWSSYWQEHRVAHGNGCSDIDLSGHLLSDTERNCFREFLTGYVSWLHSLGDSIPPESLNARFETRGMRITEPVEVTYLVAFVEKIEAVLDGDLSHAAVSEMPAVRGTPPNNWVEQT